MHRWSGLGVIADNLINIGHAMEKLAAPYYRVRRPPVTTGGFCLAQRN
jgi:hypothetical protein